MWYILIHWDGGAVNGFISPGTFTKEEAIKDIKNRLIKAIILQKVKKSKESKYNSGYCDQEINRLKGFLRCFQKPWRVTKKGDSVIKIQKIDFSVEAGYWLTEIITRNSTCNILPSTTWIGNKTIEG